MPTWRRANAIAAAAVWLRRHPQGSVALPKVAVVVASASLLITIVVAANGTTQGSFGTAEALALLGVLFVVSRRGDAGWAVIGVGSTVIAVGLLPLRGGVNAAYVIVGLMLALGATAVAVGRPYAYGLAVGGTDGIVHVLRSILAEADLIMAVDGYPTLADLTRNSLRRTCHHD